MLDDVCRHLNVDHSAPREDMVTFKCHILHLVKIKIKKIVKPQFSLCL